MFIEVPIRYSVNDEEAEKFEKLGIEPKNQEEDRFNTDLGCININEIVRFNASDEKEGVTVVWLKSNTDPAVYPINIELDYRDFKDRVNDAMFVYNFRLDSILE